MARRFQFEYPEWFPGSARAEVDRVLLVHEELFVVAHVSPDGGAVGPDEADRAAIAHVVAVFQVIVREACKAARPFGWSAERLRTTTENLLARLVEHTYQDKHSKRDWYRGQPGRAVTREDFAARVHDELRQSPGWTPLQATIRDLSVGGQTEAAADALSATPSQMTSPPIPDAAVERTAHVTTGTPAMSGVSGDASRLLTREEAAERLRVHPATLRRMYGRKEIAMTKVGRQWRVPESEVLRLERLPQFKYR